MAVDPAQEEEDMDLIGHRPDYLAVADDTSESRTWVLANSRTHSRRCRVPRGIAAATLAVGAVAGAMLFFARTAAPKVVRSDVQAAIEAVEWASYPPCGLMEHGISYEVGPPEVSWGIGQYEGVDYDTLCRHKCFRVAECQMWTWNTDKTCRLMGVNQHRGPRKVPKAGATSGGMPCHMDQMLSSGTLYCWVLMQPDSYETDLLRDQFQKHISIFNCEDHAIISNKLIQVDAGLVTEVVEIDLSCESGGEFGTALNLDIFIQVWNHIVTSGVYLNHDWTVKSDPDAVFFADRLRGLLPHHPEEGKGVYLNNCKFGMHGPVEVFSRNAVGALHNNWGQCQAHFTQKCGGDCQWGEDMFIDQCLKEVVGARRDNEWALLAEDHCLEGQDQWSPFKCDGTKVAFHPFKDTGSYSQCFSNAWAAGDAAVKEQNQEVQPPR